MSPQEEIPPYQSSHYPTLADYGCAREGMHVFFFLNRRIYYGGQITGAENYGSFYLNGENSPLGREASSDIVWDESNRKKYESADQEGVFFVGNSNDEKERCQPFLIQFKDTQDLAGNYIISDQLYFKLGEFSYPLPANTIAGQGFCTLTPGETEILLELLREDKSGKIEAKSEEKISLEKKPTQFEPSYGINSPEDALYESHLEAFVAANPNLLPPEIRPNGAAICRQVPISPPKPYDLDKADLCYFKEDQIEGGRIPNTVIELKNKRAGKSAAEQVKRYIQWLSDRLGDKAKEVDFYVFAKSFTGTFDSYIPERFEKQVKKLKHE